jgi:hypothetical protein
VVDCTVSHDLEVLGQQLALGLWVVKAVGEAHTIDRILRNAVDFERRCATDNLMNGGDDVVAVMELCARCGIGFNLCRPLDA